MVKKETVETRPNEKIENLNLIALRKYACAKINSQKDWYLKCVECPGLDSCRAGKRAVEIIENDTKPSEKKIPESSVKFVEALKHPDPAQWLFDNGYYDKKWRANDALKKWRKNHENLEDFIDGFKRAGITKAENAKARIEKFFEGCNSEEELLKRFMADTPDSLTSAVISRIYDWQKKYPKLIGKHPECKSLMRKMYSAQAKGESGYKKGVSLQEVYNKYFGEADEEEVSVEDFLSEMENEPATDTVEIPVDNFLKDHEIHDPDGNVLTTVEAKEVLKQKEKELNEKLLHQEGNMTKSEALAVVFGDKSEDGLSENSDTQIMLLQVFGRKKQELRRRFAMIDAQVQTLIAEKKIVQEQMDLLDKTAELFGMRPTNTRDAQL